MAQQRNCIVYEDSQTLHTKLVGKLYDQVTASPIYECHLCMYIVCLTYNVSKQCQDTLVQFGTFLANSCTMDDYSKKIPDLAGLVKEYHVSPDVAFFLWRPIFAFQIGVRHLLQSLPVVGSL